MLGLLLGLALVLCKVSADETPAVVLPPAAEKQVDFETDIRPLLLKRCTECHGNDTHEAGLRLDRGEQALLGSDNGPVILAKKSAESLLIQLVAGLNPEKVMPPDGEPLSAEEIGLIRAWIDQGADWPLANDPPLEKSTHWAFQPLADVTPPTSEFELAAGMRNEIDAFVLSRLRAHQMMPSLEADRATLIRRLSLDLTGLLPTPAEIDDFQRDASSDAYEQLVDRLLASPRFGEHWGRHWLDKARYADSDGYEKDNPRPDAWRYRDWVIDAINDDMPYDQFTIEQLAGDLLPQATEDQRLATAFHRQTLTNTEGGTDQEQFRVEATVDRVNTTGAVWMGLTVGCAQCHTHKYDPISQAEFYQLFAFFNNGDETTTRVPISEATYDRYLRDLADYHEKQKSLDTELQARKDQLSAEQQTWEQELQAELPHRREYHAIDVVRMSADDAGVTFQKLEDGSYLAGGNNPDKAKYELVFTSNLTNVTGLKLEALADESLGGKGPGRIAHGNFVVHEVTLHAAPSDEFKDEHQVKFASAEADFSQEQFSAAAAIDGDEKTGWAISPQMGQNHHLMLQTSQTLSNEGTTWYRVIISQQHGGQHTLGRFRLQLQTGDELPPSIRDILEIAFEQRTAEQQSALLAYYVTRDETAKSIVSSIAAHQQQKPPEPKMDVRVIAQRTSDPRKTYLLRRGDFLSPITSNELRPSTLHVLHSFQPREPATMPDRLDLAHWLMSSDNPLTPRVAVNQVWEHLFERGLVGTLNDFGVRGDAPSHPELLDWLSREYLRLGWSRKQLIRLIVTSATYRQSSAHRVEYAETDPQNILLHRQNRFRVQAESLRDITLEVSGLLSQKIGGPSVFPPMPPEIAALSYANNFRWNTSEGDDRYRRGMYTFFKRTSPHPNLMTFDCPDMNVTSLDRMNSNTPLQALVMLNEESFVEAARTLGTRLLTSPSSEEGSRIHVAFRLTLGREPLLAEQQAFIELLNSARTYYRQHPDQSEIVADPKRPTEIPPAESAAWTILSRTVLNLDEFVTRE
ncbi:MAG: PSD1 and planctomycete cytochrome C domain-containing protein [Planctomycetota bacterium]|nr:PSD1 and planctomycete cytochrome C domain-containing protein [Planctomycetota bacterium]MDA1212624.1 PSD1 and planctomycete cytochrome C domain-containing protein [Planctomycetota bacterium]